MNGNPEYEGRELEQLFAMSLDLICIATMDGHFRKVNPAFSAVLGHSAEALLASPFLDFVHPDDRAPTLAVVASLGQGVPTVTFENRYRCADETYRWLAWRAVPVQAEGIIYAIARDVTQERIARAAIADREAQLRAVFDGAVDAFFTMSDRGVIESCNNAAERMFGRARDELVGHDVTILMPEPHRSRHASYLARYLSTGDARIIGRGQRELLGVRADESTFALELSVAEIALSDRRLFLGIVRDVSERKRTEAVHAALLAQEAQSRGRIEAAAGIIHDLGNSLTGIAARAVEAQSGLARAEENDSLPRTIRFVREKRDVLASALGPAKADALGDMLEGIHRTASNARIEAANGLAKLQTFVGHAQDLLTVHRAQSGAGNAPSGRGVSVASLLVDVQTMQADALASRGGRLEVRASSEVRRIVVDGVRLLRALINGIHNAVDAYDSEPESPAPIVRVTVDLRGDDELWLCVIDNGPGFDGPGERFFVEGFSTRARGSGHGLGAVRRSLAALDGSVTLTSEGLGRGATLAMKIPVRQRTLQ